MNDEVLVGEFIYELISSLRRNDNISKEKCFAYALDKRIIDNSDVSSESKPIKRRTAARMLHEVMQNILEEKDISQWQSALVLKDLFDCNRCVNHIAQVYAKGIISVNDDMCFRSDATITHVEMKEMISKLLDQHMRIIPEDHSDIQYQLISEEETQKILRENAKALLVDVRSKTEYERMHRPFSLHYPLMEILKNPYIVSWQKDIPIILYCEQGYQSAIAANAMIEVGYCSIYVMQP